MRLISWTLQSGSEQLCSCAVGSGIPENPSMDEDALISRAR
jgi:hypothetical protein